MRKLIESTLVSLDGVIGSPERRTIFDEEATQRSMPFRLTDVRKLANSSVVLSYLPSGGGR